jgi:uncharacterized protein YprB with RNaseH-like and TPR domain
VNRDVTAELRQVIRRIEAKTAVARMSRPPSSLEALVGGAVEETDRGRLLVVRRRFPLGHAHGAQPLAATGTMAPESLALLGRAEGAPPEARRLLYLDTETTGLAGGTGTYAFLVGAGFFDGDEFEVRQYFMRDLDEEPALLAALEGCFKQFEGFVTYNGTGFDLPLLETRFVLGRTRWPGEFFHVDLLPQARRLWGGRLLDCRLGTVEQHVLGFAREEDVPGALIPSIYFDYLRRKLPGTLPRVFDHNRHDILSLAALTGWVAGAVARAPDPDFHPVELAGLGRLWEPRDPERGEACYRMALARGLPSPERERLLLRLAWREKRRARWIEARSLWEAAARSARGFDPRPWEEMAKVDEHRRRDFLAAHRLVQEALTLARAHRAPESVLGALAHRLERLARRARLAGALSPLVVSAG